MSKKDIEIIEENIYWYNEQKNKKEYALYIDIGITETEELAKAIENILQELEQEKEKNKELQKYMKEYLIPKSTINLVYVSKDKIRNVLRKAQDYDLSFKDIALFKLIEDLLKEN